MFGSSVGGPLSAPFPRKRDWPKEESVAGNLERVHLSSLVHHRESGHRGLQEAQGTVRQIIRYAEELRSGGRVFTARVIRQGS